MRQLIKTTTIALLIGGTFAITTPALASPVVDTVTTTIDQRDLATDYGVERVYKALERKAEDSCDYSRRITLAAKRFEDECTRQLLEDFVFDIDNSALTQYHKNGLN